MSSVMKQASIAFGIVRGYEPSNGFSISIWIRFLYTRSLFFISMSFVSLILASIIYAFTTEDPTKQVDRRISESIKDGLNGLLQLSILVTPVQISG